MNESRRVATQEQGAAGVAAASSSSPLEGPEKRRKPRKGKGGAGRRGPPREESGPAVPPKLKEMTSQESAVGQTVVLRCEASSEHTSLKFKWLKNGKEITKRNRPENVKIKSPKKQKTFSELRISKASLDDAGEYTCKASNRFGDDSTNAEVTIIDTSEPTGMIPVLTKGVNAPSQLIDTISASTEGTNASSKIRRIYCHQLWNSKSFPTSSMRECFAHDQAALKDRPQCELSSFLAQLRCSNLLCHMNQLC